jgi:cobalamin biosynthetic protein CobC
MTLKAELAPLEHGGDLGAAARRMFPGAPEPFLDLSTGINPNPYPLSPLPPEASTRLPNPLALAKLTAIAAAAYAAPSPAHVVAGPGTQILVAQTAILLARPGVDPWRRPIPSTRVWPNLPAITWSRSPT